MMIDIVRDIIREIEVETREKIELNEGSVDFFLFVRADNRLLLTILNAFYRRGLTFDYDAVVWTVPFLRREDRFKIYNFRRV